MDAAAVGLSHSVPAMHKGHTPFLLTSVWHFNPDTSDVTVGTWGQQRGDEMSKRAGADNAWRCSAVGGLFSGVLRCTEG